MPVVWAVALRPPWAAAEAAVSLQLAVGPAVAAQPLVAQAASVVQPRLVPDAAAAVAGSPAVAARAAVPAAHQMAVARPTAACGWRYRVAVRADGPAGDPLQAAATCLAQPNWGRLNSARSRAALPAASGSRCPAADRHPADGGSPGRTARSATASCRSALRCLGQQYLALRCWAQRHSVQPPYWEQPNLQAHHWLADGRPPPEAGCLPDPSPADDCRPEPSVSQCWVQQCSAPLCSVQSRRSVSPARAQAQQPGSA
jgi:hypothetical protein